MSLFMHLEGVEKSIQSSTKWAFGMKESNHHGTRKSNVAWLGSSYAPYVNSNMTWTNVDENTLSCVFLLFLCSMIWYQWINVAICMLFMNDVMSLNKSISLHIMAERCGNIDAKKRELMIRLTHVLLGFETLLKTFLSI